MKGKILACAVFVIILASITVVMHVKSSDVMIESNVDALTETENYMPPCERISVCYPLSDYVCYVTFSNGKMRFCFDYYAIKK